MKLVTFALAATMLILLAFAAFGQEAPMVCTEEYAPVCGRAGSVMRTYPNACHARAAQAVIVAAGPCGGAHRGLMAR